MSTNRPLRLKDFEYVGLHRYHVRVSTWHRRGHLVEHAVAITVREQLLLRASECGFEIPAYCVMPDHVHALAEGKTTTADLKRFVGRWKQHTAFAFRSIGRTRLWQPGFFDRVLREQESSRTVARYIVENPVRAAIVERVNEYPFSWCAWLDDPSFWD